MNKVSESIYSGKTEIVPMASLNPEKNTEDFNIKDLKLLMDVYDAVSDSEEIYCGLPALEDIRCLMAKVSQRIIL